MWVLVLLCLLLAPVAASAQATLLFSDGFESGDLSLWFDDTDEARVTTEKAHTGTFSLKMDQNTWGGSGEIAKTVGDRDQIYVSLWWWIPVGFSGTGSGNHFWRLGSAGSNQLDTQETGSQLAIISFWPGEVAHFNTSALPEGSWFHFAFFFKLNTIGSANGELKIWVNDELKFSTTGRTYRSSATNPINKLRLITNWDTCTAPCYFYYDDVQIWTAVPSSQCVVCACDFNDDGVVGGPDQLILANKFGKFVPTCTQGDCTGDGRVGGPDQLKLGQTFGHVGACIP